MVTALIRRWSACLLVVGMASAASNSAYANSATLSCTENSKRHAIYVAPQTWHSFAARERSNFSPDLEAYGSNSFYLVLNNGWVLSLIRQPHGWALRLLDSEDTQAVDLTQMTPPISGSVPNPRDLFGWHFRNKANTGPNMGDVNAPQLLRLFNFSTALIGTGGFKPSRDLQTDPDQGEGRGWLKIQELGFSDLHEGMRATLNYLKFEVCLTWPKSEQEQAAELDYQSLEFTEAELELLQSCGLNLKQFALDPLDTRPRMLSGDIDGDDALDQVVRLVRQSDGRRGLGVCRAGTWFKAMGFDDEPGYTANLKHVISAFSVWSLSREPVQSFGKPWPVTKADVLVLERPEKGMAWLHWQEGSFFWTDVYQFVEP